MNSKLIVPAISVMILSSCMTAPKLGTGLEIIPVLPIIVEISDEPYYRHQGYHYYYSNDRWQYSTSRNGPWAELPKSHWPKETRHNRSKHHR